MRVDLPVDGVKEPAALELPEVLLVNPSHRFLVTVIALHNPFIVLEEVGVKGVTTAYLNLHYEATRDKFEAATIPYWHESSIHAVNDLPLRL